MKQNTTPFKRQKLGHIHRLQYNKIKIKKKIIAIKTSKHVGIKKHCIKCTCRSQVVS